MARSTLSIGSSSQAASLWRLGLIEGLSCTVLFPLFWIPMQLLGDAGWPFWVVWLYHFIGVILTDVAFLGSYVNPAFVVATLAIGGLSQTEAAVRLFAELVAAFFGFRLMNHFIAPSFSDPTLAAKLTGPGFDQKAGILRPALAEGVLTALFAVVIALNIKLVPKSRPWLRRAVPAAALRVCMQAGATISGGCMNPLVALSWLAESSSLSNYATRLDYLLVYVVAPIVGGVVGFISVSTCDTLLSSKPIKARSRSK